LTSQLSEVLGYESRTVNLSDSELAESFGELVQSRAALSGTADLTWGFALVREAARRTLDQHPYPEQVLAGLAIAAGCIAELATGEGKTLSATMPAAWFATAQRGVYVATSNDYLAQRDCEWMGQVYAALGLSTRCSVPQMALDDIKAAYAADITYSTAQQFGFDFLKDMMALNLQDLAQRGHYAAIIDEADSLLIDEARTALIMSGPDQRANPDYAYASTWATGLVRDEDYLIDTERQEVALGPKGAQKAEAYFGVENLYDDPALVSLTHTVLKAHALYERGRDYIVTTDEVAGDSDQPLPPRSVVVVDTKTGRPLPSRRFQEGIHEAIEAKEGLDPRSPQITYTSITIPGFFGRFLHFGGMTGTALTDSAELMSTYGTPVAQIPPHRPRQRIDHPDRLYVDKSAKYNALVAEVAIRHANGQPVLIGTPSVGEAVEVSQILDEHGIDHSLLSAQHHTAEAAVIAQAGKPGAVTVATNMAGRGVDIKLGGERPAEQPHPPATEEADAATDAARVQPDRELVIDAGGLVVIGTARHDARRVDDQLRGRAGRQGEPGESMFLLSCEDDLIVNFGGQNAQQLLARLGYGSTDKPITNPALSKMIESAQRKIEDYHAETRENLLKYDRVVHVQRDAFWSWRSQLLDLDFEEYAEMMLANGISGALDEHLTGKLTDLEAQERLEALGQAWPFELPEGTGSTPSRVEFVALLTQAGLEELQAKYEALPTTASTLVLRHVLLQNLDMAWAQHLRDLELVQTLVGLRQHSQQDPRTVFAHEAVSLFEHHLNQSYASALRLLWDTTPVLEDSST
jgi:preprotein translocase subunit SecA